MRPTKRNHCVIMTISKSLFVNYIIHEFYKKDNKLQHSKASILFWTSSLKPKFWNQVKFPIVRHILLLIIEW